MLDADTFINESDFNETGFEDGSVGPFVRANGDYEIVDFGGSSQFRSIFDESMYAATGARWDLGGALRSDVAIREEGFFGTDLYIGEANDPDNPFPDDKSTIIHQWFNYPDDGSDSFWDSTLEVVDNDLFVKHRWEDTREFVTGELIYEDLPRGQSMELLGYINPGADDGVLAYYLDGELIYSANDLDLGLFGGVDSDGNLTTSHIQVQPGVYASNTSDHEPGEQRVLFYDNVSVLSNDDRGLSIAEGLAEVSPNNELPSGFELPPEPFVPPSSDSYLREADFNDSTPGRMDAKGSNGRIENGEFVASFFPEQYTGSETTRGSGLHTNVEFETNGFVGFNLRLDDSFPLERGTRIQQLFKSPEDNPGVSQFLEVRDGDLWLGLSTNGRVVSTEQMIYEGLPTGEDLEFIVRAQPGLRDTGALTVVLNDEIIFDQADLSFGAAGVPLEWAVGLSVFDAVVDGDDNGSDRVAFYDNVTVVTPERGDVSVEEAWAIADPNGSFDGTGEAPGDDEDPVEGDDGGIDAESAPARETVDSENFKRHGFDDGTPGPFSELHPRNSEYSDGKFISKFNPEGFVGRASQRGTQLDSNVWFENVGVTGFNVMIPSSYPDDQTVRIHDFHNTTDEGEELWSQVLEMRGSDLWVRFSGDGINFEDVLIAENVERDVFHEIKMRMDTGGDGTGATSIVLNEEIVLNQDGVDIGTGSGLYTSRIGLRNYQNTDTPLEIVYDNFATIDGDTTTRRSAWNAVDPDLSN